MAEIKNGKYKVHNGTDFDTIHFETKASQVIANDGSNLESHLAENASKHIAESGSNENGSYIKFDDGTMFCHSRVPFNGVLANTQVQSTSPLPATFIGIPSVTVSVGAPNVGNSFDINYLYGTASNGTTLTVRLSVGSSASGTQRYETYFIALGRWKA